MRIGTEEIRQRAGEQAREYAGEGLDRAADAAHRVESWARGHDGAAARLAGGAEHAARSLEQAGVYVRSRSVPGMRSDLERRVRREPLRSLAVAAVAGYLVGRIVR